MAQPNVCPEHSRQMSFFQDSPQATSSPPWRTIDYFATLQEMTPERATTALSFVKTKYVLQVSLEKHPSFVLALTAELPFENLTLTDFMDAGKQTKRSMLPHIS